MASIAGTTRVLKSQLRRSSNPIAGLLSEERVAELCDTLGHVWRRRFWTPTVVILTFLRQILLTDCSCRQTVAFTLADPALNGVARSAAVDSDSDSDPDPGPVGADPSAYSQARKRLPQALFEGLNEQIVSELAEPDRRWRGHRVRVIDGSSMSMPDTPALQEVFPQPTSQKKGCGFPVARLLAMFCWASGALVTLLYDSLAIGELTLFRRLISLLEAGDVVLADRLFGTYTELALLKLREVFAVCRVSASRHLDLRRGTRLGEGDHRQVWPRPPRSPLGLTPEEWATVPETLTVRVVRFQTVCQRGFRQRTITLVTTLVDAVAYPSEALAELYRERWLAELSLRSLKTTQGMDVLRCQSPEMVRKEIVMHQLTYNLIRLLMARAAGAHGVDPHRLSFAAARQHLLARLPHWTASQTPRQQQALLDQLLALIAKNRLPKRPDRHEPRAIKRRRKSFPYLVHPRHVARNLAYYDKR